MDGAHRIGPLLWHADGKFASLVRYALGDHHTFLIAHLHAGLIHPAEILILDRSGDDIGFGCNSMTLIQNTQTDNTETDRTNITMAPHDGSHEILLQSRIKRRHAGKQSDDDRARMV